MKTVVTGSTGMLGSAIVRELQARGESPIAWTRTTDCDLVDTEAVRRILRFIEPEVIINCAAVTDADWCEGNPMVTRAVNAFVPGDLATIAKELGARMIHISTDAVYRDDEPGLRREDDNPRPLSVYAETKLEGEGRVLAAYPEALVVRTTMFGWTLKTAPRPKFAEQILAALTNRQQIKLFEDAFFSPLHVGTLAEYLLDLAVIDVEGVLNLGSVEPVSKWYFGRSLAGIFGLDASFIEAVSVDDVPLKARRTKNVGMSTAKLSKIFRPIPRVEDQLQILYQEAFNGTALEIRERETYP